MSPSNLGMLQAANPLLFDPDLALGAKHLGDRSQTRYWLLNQERLEEQYT